MTPIYRLFTSCFMSEASTFSNTKCRFQNKLTNESWFYLNSVECSMLLKLVNHLKHWSIKLISLNSWSCTNQIQIYVEHFWKKKTGFNLVWTRLTSFNMFGSQLFICVSFKYSYALRCIYFQRILSCVF